MILFFDFLYFLVHVCPRFRIENGNIDYIDTGIYQIPVLGERADIICYDGHKAIGQSTRTCLEGQIWSGGEVGCNGMYYTPITLIYIFISVEKYITRSFYTFI